MEISNCSSHAQSQEKKSIEKLRKSSQETSLPQFLVHLTFIDPGFNSFAVRQHIWVLFVNTLPKIDYVNKQEIDLYKH